jgi:hypothetical protein
MTPERLAEIRSYGALNWNTSKEMAAEIVELCDALEAAWAELEAFRDSGLFEMWTQERERAERAEAEHDRLLPLAARWVREGQVAVEALDRVRALCDDEPNWNGPEVNSEVRWFANDIRAALDGGAE